MQARSQAKRQARILRLNHQERQVPRRNGKFKAQSSKFRQSPKEPTTEGCQWSVSNASLLVASTAKTCHCERSEAISMRIRRDCFVVRLLAMTRICKGLMAQTTGSASWADFVRSAVSAFVWVLDFDITVVSHLVGNLSRDVGQLVMPSVTVIGVIISRLKSYM